jgi:YidC/Oxa1 family membrane protein insertase
MTLWTSFVDLTYALLFALAGAFGGNMAVAIAVLSALVRLALLPLTLRIAYRSLAMQEKIKRIEPQLAAVRKRYKDDPRRLLEETAKLYREYDIVAKTSRFLWIGDLARPDGLLLAITAAVIALSAVLAPNVSAQQRPLIFVVTAVITILLMSKVAAGVMIYTLTSSGVGLVQTALVRRHARRVAR